MNVNVNKTNKSLTILLQFDKDDILKEEYISKLIKQFNYIFKPLREREPYPFYQYENSLICFHGFVNSLEEKEFDDSIYIYTFIKRNLEKYLKENKCEGL